MIAKLRLRGYLPVLFIAVVLAAAIFAPRLGIHQGFVIDAQAYPPCSALSLTANPASPQKSGTPIVFTATSTCPNPGQKYEFWMRAASQPDWVMIQAYSTNNQYNWNSTGAAPGGVYFGVWVLDANSSNTFDQNTSILFTVQAACGPTTITANPTTVQQGVHSTLTGATTCAHAGPLYEFWLRTSSSDWFLARPYSTLATYDWNSTGAPTGTIYFGLWVKDASSTTSTFDDNASTTVTVTAAPPPCNVPTVTAAPPTVVHGAGTHVIVTASATCTHASPLYQFWLRTSTSDWFMVQAYSTTATYNWDSTGAPVTTVYIGVWVKDSASTTTSFDNNNSVAIPVT